ncbi:MAG: DUF4349 domain-containing protein [Oscillospiraceae bacterium]|nr:DUF4349 domain-containing protein [Oscillospiraceae bacterium]
MKRFISIFSLLLVFAIIATGCAAESVPTGSMPAGAPGAAPSAPSPSLSPAGVSAPRAESTEHVPEIGHDASITDESAIYLPLLTPSASRGRRIVYTVNMNVQTTEFFAGRRLVVNTLTDMDGFVERVHVLGRDMRFPQHERSAQFTIRIHADRLSEFLVVIQDNFNEVEFLQESDDVTVTYEHSESTLDDLRAQERRLFGDLENAELTAPERRTLERMLTDVQVSIRTHERRLSTFDDLVLYSTVNIHLFEVIFPEEIPEEIIYEPTFGERFTAALNRSGAEFIVIFQSFIILIIRVLPALVVIAILAVIAILVRRKIMKSRSAASQRYDSASVPPTQQNESAPVHKSDSDDKDE